jgi:hypothetical protein
MATNLPRAEGVPLLGEGLVELAAGPGAGLAQEVAEGVVEAVAAIEVVCRGVAERMKGRDAARQVGRRASRTFCGWRSRCAAIRGVDQAASASAISSMLSRAFGRAGTASRPGVRLGLRRRGSCGSCRIAGRPYPAAESGSCWRTWLRSGPIRDYSGRSGTGRNIPS